MKFASICVLAFERPEFLVRSLDSLLANTKYPYELIINDDASSGWNVRSLLFDRFNRKQISHLILNDGKNMGIGRAFRNCIGVSNGDYIFKLDADLEYKPGWLSTVIDIINENEDVGCVGLFDYLNYDSKDTRFKKIEERTDCFVVSDFVNSGYGFKREIWNKFGYALGDDGWQLHVQSQTVVDGIQYKSLIPKEDLVLNFGFGKNSVFVNPDGTVRKKSKLPKLFPEK